MPWITFKPCRDDDFVNCTFGERGECLNPTHNPNVNAAKDDIKAALAAEEEEAE